ncbi:carbohydrate ABC transporter permease [Spirochaeta africana]|uniref:ABC-type sugar transport system, permease component n=1 Tax=Spirochaeta africana (strain ATCC 700263 / DSM 8902 / Z-7692) TaxID=889378 RepID=H9UH06_SPIAZ|nr:carbohydrate ABC transporter permease [Spirochaeta africana]AFG36799.1 ABC-type sugar transport system, permease component [Spirochaeta africana DSM 8902]
MKNKLDTLNRVGKTVVLYSTLLGFAVLFFFPFYYMFVIASHPRATMFRTPPNLWFGGALMTNIRQLLYGQQQIPFLLNYYNSVAIALLTVVTTVFFCTMGGFALAKYEFRFKTFIFFFIMATLAFPPFLNIIPFYRMMAAFGWINKWRALIVPGMANAMGIFLMRQYLEESIPKDLLDAARIDGMSEFRILLRIVFPLAKPAMGVLSIIVFVGQWNNFLGAFILLPGIRRTTLPVALNALNAVSYGQFGMVYAGTALTILPLLLVFFVASRQFISGLTAGSIKG